MAISEQTDASNEQAQTEERETASGTFGAGVLAGGIGSAAMGLMVTLAAASKGFSDALNWYSPVGPLSGKAGVSIAVWIVSWVALHFALKDKQVRVGPVVAASIVLIGIGFAFTFPPIFEVFAHG